MKKTILLSLSILWAVFSFAQSNATNFTCNDCNGVNHDLFTELDQGKVIVIVWVMPCASCIGPALQAYTAAKSYASTYPEKVLYYLADDYANTSCSQLSSWAGNASMGDADAYFSNSAVSMSNYGQPGMPKVVVVGCSDHKVYFNKNYTADGINEAIDAAITECDYISSVEETGNNNFELNLYPNPTHGIASVSYKLTEASLVKIDVLNILGESLIDISNSQQNIGIIEFKLNTNSLSDGVYFLRVQSNMGSQLVKFSVSH